MRTINFAENSNVVRNETIEALRREINAYKTLNRDELMQTIIKAQNGSQRAKDKAVKANLRFVWSVAAHYCGMDNFLDVFQNGSMGLCMAVETFDVSRETSFSTWALELIRKYINIGLTDESRTVRMGAHMVKGKANYCATSFDAPIGNEDGEDKTLLDFFASDLSADNFSKVEDMRIKVNYLMQGLKPIEKEIICGLFGLGCREYTQYELSLRFDLTEERIRQIKFEALKKMQEIA